MRRDSKRNLNLRTAPLERSHCSFRLIRSPLFAFSDAPPGRRSARSPAAFWSRTKDLVGFSGYFRFLPEFAANSRFCRFFPPVTRYFRVFPDGFKLDIRHIKGSTDRCNHPGCSMVTNIDLCVLPIPEEPPDTFPANPPCSGSLHIF